MTAFFPVSNPKYAVTVLAEDGGYGNVSAAPVLRQIAGALMQAESYGRHLLCQTVVFKGQCTTFTNFNNDLWNDFFVFCEIS